MPVLSHISLPPGEIPSVPANSSLRITRARRFRRAGFTLVEVMVATALLALTAITATQALLHLNRQAALSRVSNAAKAEALSRIQQVSQCAYNPDALLPVIPSILTIGTTTAQIDLGSTLTDLGSIPGTATWTVSSVSGSSNTRSVRSTITYKYLGRNLSYELFTYKSPD
jgi:prepilin-type N-terminal cleavage/methylation domain-containing protein